MVRLHGSYCSWFYEENVDIIDKNIILGSYFITTQDTSFIEQTVINGGFKMEGMIVVFISIVQ